MSSRAPEKKSFVEGLQGGIKFGAELGALMAALFYGPLIIVIEYVMGDMNYVVVALALGSHAIISYYVFVLHRFAAWRDLV